MARDSAVAEVEEKARLKERLIPESGSSVRSAAVLGHPLKLQLESDLCPERLTVLAEASIGSKRLCEELIRSRSRPGAARILRGRLRSGRHRSEYDVVAAALDCSRLVLFFGDERLVEEKTLPARRLHELVPQR